MNLTHLDAITRFVYEQGFLKRLPRSGWLVAGVNNPESIAEHSFRTAQLACLLAIMEGGDPGRATLLALFHDSQETRTGDVPYVAHPYVTTTNPEKVTADQIAEFPEQLATHLRELVAEFEAGETTDARAARDADKLECLFQALEYRAQGNNDTQDWIDSSLNALQTTSAKQLAETALEQPPRSWWEHARGKQ